MAALLGILIGRASAERPESHSAKGAKPVAAEPTRRSAVVAAIDYLSALRWNVLVDDTRRLRVIERRATAEAAPQLDAELAAPAESLRAAITRPPVVARTAVLGYRVEEYRPGRASVSVWGMALFGTGAYEPATQWSTSRVDLVWSSERWLVSAVRSRGGPSPDSSVGELASADRSFRKLRRAP